MGLEGIQENQLWLHHGETRFTKYEKELVLVPIFLLDKNSFRMIGHEKESKLAQANLIKMGLFIFLPMR